MTKRKIIIILLISISNLLVAQRSRPSAKQLYINGLQLQDSLKHIEAISILDSSRKLYIANKYLASASKSAFAIDSSFQALGYSSDSILPYYRELLNLSNLIPKYKKSETIRDLLEHLANIYNKNGNISLAINTRLDLEERFMKYRKQDKKYRLNNEINLAQLKLYEGDFDTIPVLLKRILKYRKNNSENRFKAHILKTQNTIKSGDTSSANSSIDLLINEKYKSETLEKKSDLYGKILEANLDYEKGNYKVGLKKIETIKLIDTSYLTLNAILYESLATGFIENGAYDTALVLVNKALSIYQNKLGYVSFHPITSNLYNQLAYIYYLKSDYGYTKEIVKEHIQIKRSQAHPHHPDFANAYYLLGLTNVEQEKYTEALPYIDSSLLINTDIYKEDHLKIALSNNLRGVCLLNMKRLEEAESHLKSALSIYQRLIPNKNHIYFAKVYNDLGSLYQAKNENTLAISNYLKALKIYEKLLGKVHPYLSFGYYNIGTLHEKENKYSEALHDYQKAIQANVVEFNDSSIYSNPKLDGVLSNMILLKTLIHKAQTFGFIANQRDHIDSNIPLFKTELDTYLRVTDLVDKLKTSYVSEDSKAYLSEKTAFVYEKGIEVSLKLFNGTKDSLYKETAFRFSEKSKVGSLLSAINEVKAKKMGGVPDSLLIYEENLINTLTSLDSELLNELNKGTKANKKAITKLKREILSKKAENKSFLNLLENNYNKYYELKYSTYTPSIKDARALLVDTSATSKKKKRKLNHTLIEYFEGADAVYTYVIGETTFEIITTPKDSSYTKLFSGLRNAVTYHKPKYYERYSSLIYKKIVSPALEFVTTDNIMIVPDGNTLSLPFEILHKPKKKIIVKDENPDLKTYKKFRYLIKDYNISYSYSVSLSKEIKKQKRDYTQRKFFGMAPIFSPIEDEKVLNSNQKYITSQYNSDSVSTATVEEMKLKPLPGTLSEVQSIFKVSKTKGNESLIFMERMAKESNLKLAKEYDYNILHLATHSSIDPNNPQMSKILLMPDEKEDGILTINEIFILKLHTDLVCLSSCQTGLGHYVRGEGVMSFCRSFFYAGTQSLLVSMWKVPDGATSILMQDFYKRLYAKEFDKLGSLRKAKLKMAKQTKYADPYNWAPFVLIGK